MYEIGKAEITDYVSGPHARGAISSLRCLTDEALEYQQAVTVVFGESCADGRSTSSCPGVLGVVG